MDGGESNITTVCRACLSPNENMRDLLSDSTQTAGLSEMFNKICTFKVRFFRLCFVYLIEHCDVLIPGARKRRIAQSAVL